MGILMVQGVELPDDLVFQAPMGGPLSYTNWRRRVWLAAVTAAGLPTLIQGGLPALGSHDLRRANATALVRLGVDVKTAQVRLGHSDPRLTLGLYAQAENAADREAADHLGGRFFPGAIGREVDVKGRHEPASDDNRKSR